MPLSQKAIDALTTAKTEILRKQAEAAGFQVIDIPTVKATAEDLKGLPTPEKQTTA